MSRNNQRENGIIPPLTRTRIAKAIFAAAESMGISDRQLIEKLTTQVIQRMEQSQPVKPPQAFPGMEELVTQRTQPARLPSNEEIQAMVEEILAAEEQKQAVEQLKQIEEIKSKETDSQMKTMVQTPPEVVHTSGIKLTRNALQVLEKRYLQRDKDGKVMETPEQLFRRVAETIASAELNYNPQADVTAVADQFYRVMADLDFLPNSPTLMNAGRELGQLSACFVLPVEDSMESIFNAVKFTALIHKSGGGTGFSFNRLRPEGDFVKSTSGVASGPVSFMRAFDVVTDVTKQGGTRRGANMGILHIDHPDILKFITAKEDQTALTNFNISVAVTEKFMEAVKTGSDYDLVNPRTGQPAGKLNAAEVFAKIVDMAWRTGDPGIVFIDRINLDNPTPKLGKIESTNPCGEQPLLPYESCNLGSINLSRMLQTVKGKTEIDYVKLAETVKTAVRFLDNVIDVNKFPLPEIEKMTHRTRKIGLGVMGFADMLIQLGIPYNSTEALDTASRVMRALKEEADKASIELAKERGVFPAYKGSIYDAPGGSKIRNACRTTIAPTGTLSIIAGCSSGIEPLFALSYTRNILDGAHLIEVNPCFEQAARHGGFYSEELMQKLAEGSHLEDMDSGIPEAIKRVFITAHGISPAYHVRMQSAFQKYTDNAVSKTVNFPHEATREDVANVYMLAYEEGLKGITIYRDRSRETQVLTTGKKEPAKAESAVPGALTPRPRAKITRGVTERVTTGCGHLYVTVNSDDKGICEVFSHLGKTGGCASAQLEAICRLISIPLRAGIDVSSIVRQLKGIRCPSIAWEDGKSVLSCADAIASVLEKYITPAENDTGAKPALQDYGLAKNVAGQCPDCGNLLVYQEGCFICPTCGYTKC